jgi:hypothetical protein
VLTGHYFIRKGWMVGTDVTKPILSDVAGSCPVSHQQWLVDVVRTIHM